MYENNNVILEDCPFCAKDATIMETHIGFDTLYYVQCLHCGAKTRAESTVEDAVSNWNVRNNKGPKE